MLLQPLPILPQQGIWPSGSTDEPLNESGGGVMQVLNIVVPESRILASRERCPYLVRLEVVETDFEGSDARLYAAGAPRVGVTVEEALGAAASSKAPADNTQQQSHPSCNIPLELVPTPDTHTQSGGSTPSNDRSPEMGSGTFPRGGWQVETDGTDFMHADPSGYDAVREHEYEQLHQHMQNTQVLSNPQQGHYVER